METAPRKEASSVLSEEEANVIGGGEDCLHPPEEQPPTNPILKAIQDVWKDLVP